MFDYSKLLGLMREKHVTQETLSKEIGISSVSLWKKLHNRSEFTSKEMLTIIKVLGIVDPMPYFFATDIAISQ